MDRKCGSNMSSDRENASFFKGLFGKIKCLNFVRNAGSDNNNNRNDSPSSSDFKSEHFRKNEKNEKNDKSPRRNWQYYLTNNHL